MKKNTTVDTVVKEVLPETDQVEKISTSNSIFRGIVMACLRSKQLIKGATPRIDANPKKRKSTTIAIEEIKQGLVSFEVIPDELSQLTQIK